MLERMGVEEAQTFTAGDVVVLANLLAARNALSWEDVDEVREIARRLTFDQKDGKSGRCLFSVADRISDLLPPR